MKRTLAQILPEAIAAKRAVAGFNIFGIDEAVRVLAAAESLAQPVILMTNKDIVQRIPVEVIGPALRALADRAQVPVCVHLDHTYNLDTIYRAVGSGYTSVMYDGSQLPFSENVARTRHVVEVAHACGLSVEGEIGSVSYNDPGNKIRHELTDPITAARFCEETGVDAVAVSVGTVHKLMTASAVVDHDLLASIAEATVTPLVVHGSSGIPEPDMRKMASGPVGKFNIGTVLRRAWGETLREEMERLPDAFDRLTVTEMPLAQLQNRAEEFIAKLGWPESNEKLEVDPSGTS